MTTRKLKFPRRPLVTFETLAKAQAIIDHEFTHYVKMLRAVDPQHPWLAKANHSAKTRDNVEKVLRLYGIDPDSANAKLLAFAAYNHDLGRVIQALWNIDNKKVREKVRKDFDYYDLDHSFYTVLLLKKWHVFELFSHSATFLINSAIQHHADIRTPTYRDFPSSFGRNLQNWIYSFTYILRVADKFATMLNRTEYYVSPEGIKQQIPLMKQECVANNLPFYGETHNIDDVVMAAFSKRETFLRAICSSYEAYIGVFYMAWIFEIEDEVLLKEIADSGFIQTILAYLVRQEVPTEKIQIIRETVENYLAEHGIQ